MISCLIYIVNYEYRQREKTKEAKEIVDSLQRLNESVGESSGDGENVKSKTNNNKGVIGTISIPAIDISYPIFDTTTEENLELGITKFWGPDLQDLQGNIVLVGHNMRRKNLLFTNLDKLKDKDIIYINREEGSKEKYQVFKSEIVMPENLDSLSQDTKNEKKLTLITCSNKGTKRLVVHSKLIK